MDGQELIQVNLRLPASALDSLSALAEQLRKLTAAVNGLRQPAGTSEEIMESGFFDPERFQALRQKAESGNIQKTEAEARAVRSEVSELIGEPDRAGQGLAEEALRPEQEEPSLHDELEQPGGSFPDTDRAAEWSAEDIAVVRPEVGNTPPDAPPVRAEPDSQIPEAEGGWTRTGEAEVSPAAVQADMPAGAETPMGAGLVVTAQPEPPASRWTNMTEELVTAGPAPLTAEAVSLAFQRDGRRYDNGFPLY